MPQVTQGFIDRLAKFLLITRYRCHFNPCFSTPNEKADWLSTLLSLQQELRTVSGPVVTCWMCDPPQQIELIHIEEHDATVHDPSYQPPEPEGDHLSRHPENSSLYCSFPAKEYLHPPGNICISTQLGQYKAVRWVTQKGGPHDFTKQPTPNR